MFVIFVVDSDEVNDVFWWCIMCDCEWNCVCYLRLGFFFGYVFFKRIVVLFVYVCVFVFVYGEWGFDYGFV